MSFCFRPYSFYLTGLLLLGCGGSKSTPACVPGASLGCDCVNGGHGAQVCTQDGVLGQCQCQEPTDALPSGSGGSPDPLNGDAGAAGAGGMSGLAGATGSAGLAGATGLGGESGLAGAAGGTTTSIPLAGKTSSPDGGPSSSDGAPPTDVKNPPVVRCGDGVAAPSEPCDDGNANTGDGCTPDCLVEPGFICSGSPSFCRRSGCGNGNLDPGELCDDGNALPFDGCSQDCRYEPVCTGDGCTSRCGDGIVLGEECDDGNSLDNDGCSKDCKIEPGFTCAQPPLGDKIAVPVVYRDFRAHTPNEFEPGVTGVTAPTLGMVQNTLDDEGKPVFTGISGSGAHVSSKTSFAQWYRTTSGINHATSSKLVLYSNGTGGYVNRYGSNGEQWPITEIAYFCGDKGGEQLDGSGQPIPCTSKLIASTDCDKMTAKGEQMISCYLEAGSNYYRAVFIASRVDGNPLFFPVDGDTFTPASERGPATIPPGYTSTETWPYDVDGAGNKVQHNFSFTSEVRTWFVYDANQTYTLSFTGDDDVWVFINRKLAVDLGGIHIPANGKVTINATTAANLGLVNGKVYEVAVFQAERQTNSSTYKLTLTGFNTAPSQCARL